MVIIPELNTSGEKCVQKKFKQFLYNDHKVYKEEKQINDNNDSNANNDNIK